jgi:hypothetical protein
VGSVLDFPPPVPKWAAYQNSAKSSTDPAPSATWSGRHLRLGLPHCLGYPCPKGNGRQLAPASAPWSGPTQPPGSDVADSRRLRRTLKLPPVAGSGARPRNTAWGETRR